MLRNTHDSMIFVSITPPTAESLRYLSEWILTRYMVGKSLSVCASLYEKNRYKEITNLRRKNIPKVHEANYGLLRICSAFAVVMLQVSGGFLLYDGASVPMNCNLPVMMNNICTVLHDK